MEQSLKIALEEKVSSMKGYKEKLSNLRRSL